MYTIDVDKNLIRVIIRIKDVANKLNNVGSKRCFTDCYVLRAPKAYISGGNMKNSYVYPARIIKDAGSVLLTFPDFEEIVLAEEDEEDLIVAAQEVLALTLIDYIDQGKELPKPSKITEGVIYIHVWLPYFKNIAREIYVKKTVTIPQWLDILAKESKVNFSAALVKGIKEELGIAE